ncbi:MAG: DUF4249 domain-containing protein [Reichenbachiella sp.]
MKNLIITLVTVWTMTSCYYDRIDLDLNDESPKLAVEAWITDLDKPQYVALSRTINYLGEQKPDYVTDAVVILNDEVSDIELVHDVEGRYYLPVDWQPRYGSYYTLTISHGSEVYVARELMRVCPSIENVFGELEDFDTVFEENDFGEDTYKLTFSFEDSVGLGDGYYFVDYLEGSFVGDSITNGTYEHDQYFDGDYVEDASVTSEEKPFFLGDEAVIEMHAIGKEATYFLSDVDNEIYGNGPFDSPPANVRTNISNGAVGYFIIGGAKSVQVLIEEDVELE